MVSKIIYSSQTSKMSTGIVFSIDMRLLRKALIKTRTKKRMVKTVKMSPVLMLKH